MPAGIRIIVIVVDNDAQQSAHAAFQQAITELPVPAYYYVQPERGLSAVRNALLERALAHKATHIAFIDDDEHAPPMWLTSMLDGLRFYQADIIAGPVLPIRDGRIVPTLNTRPSGSRLQYPSSGNVVFDLRLASELDLRFDRRFDFTGGEDTDFFNRATKQGATAVWLADGILYTVVTPERARLPYRLYYPLRCGISHALVYKQQYSPPLSWLRCLIGAALTYARTLRFLLQALYRSPLQNIKKAVSNCLRASGILLGLVGITVEPYR